jgi:hypothetical protein
MEETLSATVFIIQLSYWVNFRGTLYFIAMMGTVSLLVIIVVVHRTKNAEAIATNPFQVPPIAFFGTPLYSIFRMCWFTVSIVIFLWIVNVMYEYWFFIGYYKQNTTGKLHDFWAKFDSKFVSTVIIVGIYLCWPLILLGLEIAIWFAFVLPWMLFRMMCAPTLGETRPPPETPLSEVPCCIRTDMFFSDCNQIKRIGFPDHAWYLVTGGHTPYLDCMQCQMAPMGGGPGFGASQTYPGYSGPPQQTWGQQPAVQSFQPPSRPAQNLPPPSDDGDRAIVSAVKPVQQQQHPVFSQPQSSMFGQPPAGVFVPPSAPTPSVSQSGNFIPSPSMNTSGFNQSGYPPSATSSFRRSKERDSDDEKAKREKKHKEKKEKHDKDKKHKEKKEKS